MAIKSGRVGVRPDQVDEYGRVVASDYLVDQLKEVLPPSGELVPLHVNLNGTYTPTTGTGYGPVTVSVPFDVDALALGLKPKGAITLTANEVVDYAFYHKDITRLTCPNVTHIGEGAFSSCTQLTHISSTGNITALDNAAFSACIRLTSVSMSAVQTIGNECFSQCRDLTSVTFSHATSIGTNAFEGCSNLSDVNIPLLSSIGAGAFKSCSLLTSFSNSNIVSLNADTFNTCTGLTSIDVPNVIVLGNGCFKICNHLMSAIFPKVTDLGTQVFSSVEGKLAFPSLVTTPTNSFSGWRGKEVDFGENFATIKGYTFNGMNTSATYKFDTLVLRNPSQVVTLETNNFLNTTAHFAPNQSGGTVYIPKVLYDHLGDGTSLDYMTSATWTAMLNLNSNNTFAPIEGSYYETHYADGTLINS